MNSVTFGDLPANIREAEIWEPHEWDNMTVWESRDALLRVLSECITQRDNESAGIVDLQSRYDRAMRALEEWHAEAGHCITPMSCEAAVLLREYREGK